MVRKIRAKFVVQLRAKGLSGRAIGHHSRCRGSPSLRSSTRSTPSESVGTMSKDAPSVVYWLLSPGRGEHQRVFAQPDWETGPRGPEAGRGDAETAAYRVWR